jgi:gamma-glutamyltranspeptidase/glutathione hydrolase
MLQQLALLRHLLPNPTDKLVTTTADLIHLQVECAKLAFADRDAYYGDPDFVDVPLETLLSDAYAKSRVALVGQEASTELRPGVIAGYGNRMFVGDGQDATAGAGEPTVGTLRGVRSDTVHLDVVDRHGNMVSAMPSGGWLASSPVIDELGFPLGTRAQMFVLDEQHPGALAPGKRPRTTLSPSMCLRDGAPYLAWGSPGGDYQDQWATQLLVRHLHDGMGLQEAIDAPTWQTDHLVSSFWPHRADLGSLVVEENEHAAVRRELRRRGHRVEVRPEQAGSRLTAVAQVGSVRKAAASRRGGLARATVR